MSYKLTYKPYGERAILIEWPQEIHPNILNDILSFKEKLIKKHVKPFVYLKHTYSSLLVVYENYISDFNQEIAYIDNVYSVENLRKTELSYLWRVPVCYDDEFALDLDAISKEKKRSKSDIIKWHSLSTYTVYFIGFLPGFLYLGGLDERLQIPRKPTPRLQVEKGAVAIGGNQTGVYPNASPGGWHVIGNSPINFFDVSKDQPCFAKAGDRIQFYPISLKTYKDVKSLVDVNVFQLESEVFDG